MTDAKRSQKQAKPKPGLKRSLDTPSERETQAVANVMQRLLGSPASLSSETRLTSTSSETSQSSATTPTTPTSLSSQSTVIPFNESINKDSTSLASETSPTSLSSTTSQTTLTSPSETNKDYAELETDQQSILLTSQTSLSSETRPTSSSSQTTLTSQSKPINRNLNDERSSTSLTSSNLTSSSQTSQTRQTSQSIAPTRDFMRVPNELIRDAVPAGFFIGKSKQLYDFLYSQTRGAIVPTRVVRMSRDELMKRTDIGAVVTLRSNLQRLQQIGLIRMRSIIGSHEGNEFEVFIPSEISQTSQTSSTDSSQKVDRLDRLETSQTSQSQPIDNKDTNGESNTFLKTLKDHDDLWNGLVEHFPDLGSDQIEKAFHEITSLIWQELSSRVEHAKNPPVSPAYFVAIVKSLCRSGKEKEASTGKPSKNQLLKIVQQVRSTYVGAALTISDLEEKVQVACEREGIAFDKKIFNEIAGETSKRS